VADDRAPGGFALLLELVAVGEDEVAFGRADAAVAFGDFVQGHQRISQRKPAPAATRKAACQLQREAITGTVRGAATAATEAPELKMAVARARWRLGNHWAVALMAEGKLPASPTPRARRAA